MFAGIPDFRAELLRSVDDGQTTWSEWHWSGTRTDGQAFEMRGVTLFEIADNVIVAGRLYLEDVEPDLIGIDEVVQTLSGHRPHTARPVTRSQGWPCIRSTVGRYQTASTAHRTVSFGADRRRAADTRSVDRAPRVAAGRRQSTQWSIVSSPTG